MKARTNRKPVALGMWLGGLGLCLMALADGIERAPAPVRAHYSSLSLASIFTGFACEVAAVALLIVGLAKEFDRPVTLD